jgi:hypothetical protein
VPGAADKLSKDLQMPPTKRLGLLQPIGRAEQRGKVVEAPGHVGMIRPKALFIDRQRGLVRRLN